MGTGGSIRFEGSIITPIAYCLYCDKCGSFNIGKRITLKILIWFSIWISVAAIIATLFGYSAGTLPGGLFCFASLLLLISLISPFELGHRCKKCGNTDISTTNVLNYPENDRSVLDVPYKTTIKYYLDDY